MNETWRKKLATVFLFIAVLLIAANLRASITAVGPLTDRIAQSVHLSHAEIGLLTSLPLLAFALISPLVPRISQRIGMEYALFLSMLILAIGILIRSLLPGGFALFIGTIILGAAIAAGNVLLPGLIRNRFTGKVGLLTGLYTVSMALFAGISSAVSTPLVNAGLGWRGALASWCCLALLAGLFLLPTWRAQRHSAVMQARPAIFTASALSLLKIPLAWNAACFMGIQSILFYVLAAWLPDILKDQGLSMAEGGWMFLLLQIISLPASFIAPMLAYRARSQIGVSTITAGIYAIGFFGLLSGKWLILWIVCLGIGGGAAISLALSFFTLRTRSGQQAAELSAMAQSVGYLLAAIGPVAIGALHDTFHHWIIPDIVLGSLAILLVYFGYQIGKDRFLETEMTGGHSSFRHKNDK